MLALRGRNAAILPSLSANCTSDGLGTRSARANRANARAGPINPSADLAGRATRLGLEVIAKNPRQDFDQPGCQDGLRLTLTFLTGIASFQDRYLISVWFMGSHLNQGIWGLEAQPDRHERDSLPLNRKEPSIGRASHLYLLTLSNFIFELQTVLIEWLKRQSLVN